MWRGKTNNIFVSKQNKLDLICKLFYDLDLNTDKAISDKQQLSQKIMLRSRRGSFAKFLMQDEGEYGYENDYGRSYAAQDVYHFECAWEVANKGGLSAKLERQTRREKLMLSNDCSLPLLSSLYCSFLPSNCSGYF